MGMFGDWRLRWPTLLWLLAVLLGSAAHAGKDDQWHRLLVKATPAAQTRWGLRYEHGEGVTRNLDRAVRLYCAAARSGYADAQYRLGWLYANGRGMPRDDALAAAWFSLAAAQGDDDSRRMLARLDVGGTAKPPLCISPSRSEPYAWIGDDPTRQSIAAAVNTLAPSFGLDPDLVLAVVQAESDFDPRARSPKGALGLMQLLPTTARRFGVRRIFDPVENLKGGMAYLRWLLSRFRGDVRLAVAAYNAGEQAVDHYQGVPPYPETRTYVKRVSLHYPHATHPTSSARSGPLLVQADKHR